MLPIEEGKGTPTFSEAMSKALSPSLSAIAQGSSIVLAQGARCQSGNSWASSARAEAGPRQAKDGEGSNAEISMKLGSRTDNKTGKLHGVPKVAAKKIGKKDILLWEENRLSESYLQKPCLDSELDVKKDEARLHAAQTVALHEAQSVSMHEAQPVHMHGSQTTLHEVSPMSLPHIHIYTHTCPSVTLLILWLKIYNMDLIRPLNNIYASLGYLLYVPRWAIYDGMLTGSPPSPG